MSEKKTKRAEDACPLCGGEFVVDHQQRPDVLITRKTRNADVPAVAARFADKINEKAAERGLIHRCTGCGYRDRFHSKDKAA